MKKVLIYLIPILIFFIFCGLSLSAAKNVDWTIDEPTYLEAGRYLWNGGGWETVQVRFHGPLPFYANQIFLFGKKTGDVKFKARAGMLLFSILGLFIIFIWSKSLWGYWGGVGSLLLCAFSPTFLGYGSLITADMSLSTFFILTLYTFSLWINNPKIKNMIVWGICFGLSLGTKYFALTLFPIIFLILIYHFWKHKNIDIKIVLQLIFGFILGVFILHSLYLFKVGFFNGEEYEKLLKSNLFRILASSPILKWILNIFPAPYILGADYQLAASSVYKGVFYKWYGGHPLYYLACILTKTAVPILIFFVFGLFSLIQKKKSGLFCLVFPFIFILGYLSFANSLQIGIRYILPVYPLIMILGGGGIIYFWSKNKAFKGASSILLVWLIVETIIFSPDYLGYFNEFIGGPRNGYILFADSNCDWGQNFKKGRDKLKEKYKNIKFLTRMDGPQFGVIGAYVPYLKPRDNRNPKMVYHWITRFKPIGNYSAAWLVFKIAPKDFENAYQKGDKRAKEDLAAAYINNGDLERAQNEIQGLDSKIIAEYRKIITLLKKDKKCRLNKKEWKELLGLLLKDGFVNIAINEINKMPPGINVADIGVLLFLLGKRDLAIKELNKNFNEGKLKPSGVIFLAGMLYFSGNPEKALEILKKAESPPSNSPLFPYWKELLKIVKETSKGAKILKKH